MSFFTIFKLLRESRRREYVFSVKSDPVRGQIWVVVPNGTKALNWLFFYLHFVPNGTILGAILYGIFHFWKNKVWALNT